MQPELDELAAEGGAVLLAGLRSEDWERFRNLFVRWLRDVDQQFYGSDLAELEERRPDYVKGSVAERRWHRRLREALAEAPDVSVAVAGLRALITEFSPRQQPPDPAVSSTVSAGIVTGGLLQAGSMTVSTPTESSGDHVDFRQGTFNGQVVGVQKNYGVQPGGGVIPEPESWPTVAEIDPLLLGVRPTWRARAEPELPPYVVRDADAGLRGWDGQDSLLVITGGPLSGKSRTALAAMSRHMAPTARVYAPNPGTDLRGLPGLLRGRSGRYVLWLDELEGHLGGHGLDMGLLAQLTALHVPVVATMRDEAYDEHRFGSGRASRLLSRARTERLSTGWSEDELRRLAQESDPRLAEALEWRGAGGVTQYLAVAPELWELWRSANRSSSRHPRGFLLVRAAIDLTQCGVTGDIPWELLEAARRSYGRGMVGSYGREPLAQALDWATRPLYGVAGMLLRGADRRVGESVETWRPHGSLVAAAQWYPQLTQVPAAVWRCALEGTHYDADVHGSVRTTAHALFAAKAEDGDTEAMHMMGLLGEDAEDEATVLEWFRRAADAGKAELSGRVGELLLGRGDAQDALPYLQTAAERNPDGPESRLLGQAHLALAEQWLRKSADRGDPEASHRLGEVLLGRGDTEGAGFCFTRAEMLGHAPVARSSGLLALLEGSHETAQVLLRRAADAGDDGHRGAVVENKGVLDEARTHPGAQKALAENPDTVKE